MSTSSPALPGSTEPSVETFAARLTEQLQQTRQELVRHRWFAAASSIVLFATVAVAAVALADYFVELPFLARALWLTGLLLAVAAGLCWTHLRFIAPLTLSKAAAETEGQIEQFGQRLRTTLDYHQRRPLPAQASPRLIAAMHRQTAGVAQQVDWNNVVDVRPATLAFGASAVALTGVCVALFLVPEYRTAVLRTMLLPAEYTRAEYTPHEQTVKFGDSIEIDVTIHGRPIRTAVVRYRGQESTDDAWTTIDLGRPNADTEPKRTRSADERQPTALLGNFTAKIADLKQDLDFEVLAGPRQLPLGHITVVQPLMINHVAARIVPPEYTSRPAETVESLDLKVLEGSNVELRLTLNRAAAEGTLIPIAASSKDSKQEASIATPLPLVAAGESLCGTLKDLRQAASYTVSAKTADGMSLDPVAVRIRVQLDQKPDIKFLAPQEDLSVIPTTEVPLVAEASDDLGLYKVGIQYRLDDGELRTLWEGSAEGSIDPLRADAVLLLEDLNATFRNAVSYYAFAEDNYFGAPRRTTTELRFIDIRPFKVDYQVVDSEGGCCNGSSVSLEELIHVQRRNLVAAFAARQDRPVSPENAEKLRRGEATLQEQTQQFVDGVQARIGPVPTLAIAVALMADAVEFLSQQEIDKAAEAEQQALVALMQARENLRQKLKNSNSQQASNCRKFDREFRQKLRLPKPKDSVEEKLAEARKQLDDLAERERKWGQQAQQCCNASSSSPSHRPSQNNASNEEQPEQAQAPSAGELTKTQEQMRNELDLLKKQLAALEEAGGAAQKQAEHADQAMQHGQQELQSKKGDEAAEAAETSAQRLDELADHLAALAARDFGQRLDETHRQAQEIARRQEDLAKELGASESKGPGAQVVHEEESLATRVAMLGELLDKLRRDSAGESAGIRDKLEAAVSSTPPGQIADAMTEVVRNLQANRPGAAARSAEEARDRMGELAQALAAVRGALAQPQLDELLRLEEQLAQLMEQAQRVKGASANQKSELEQKWQALAEKLARLAEADRRLAAALDQTQFQPSGGKLVPQGHYSWIELGDFHGAREVAKALQTNIQEAILAGALVDADQPIPPAYKPLVEKYYKTLSDDLR